MFRLPPEAHIYWHNPGESGLPTTVVLNASEVVTLGPIRYPGPRRFVGPGGSVSYGYAGEVALVSELQWAEAAAAAASVEVVAEASWLACTTVCRRQSATARAHLLRASSALAPSGSVRREPWQQLPVDPSPQLGAKRSAYDRLEFRAPPGVELLEFFPNQHLTADDADCINRPAAADGGLSVRLRYASPLELPVSGVLRAQHDGQEQYYRVSVP